MATLTLCMIVRDEEENLAACLGSLRPFVDEICVLDTGSSDGTLALAESAADRVERFEWASDFSAARNAVLGLGGRSDRRHCLALGNFAGRRQHRRTAQAMADQQRRRGIGVP